MGRSRRRTGGGVSGEGAVVAAVARRLERRRGRVDIIIARKEFPALLLLVLVHHLSSVHSYRVGVQSEPGCSSPFYLPTYLSCQCAVREACILRILFRR